MSLKLDKLSSICHSNIILYLGVLIATYIIYTIGVALVLYLFVRLSGISHWGVVLKQITDKDDIPIITRCLLITVR